MHKSVLLHEVIESLHIKPDGYYADVTGGGGGHSEEILKRLGAGGKLLVLDRDEEAVLSLKKKFAEDPRCQVIHGKFSDLEKYQVSGLSGLVADFGFSSIQLDDASRGLSFLTDGPLDMRLNRNDEVTAASLLGDLSEEELADVIFKYGEERHSRKLARALKADWNGGKINTTADLARIAESVLRRFYRGAKIHPATRLFQALRIAVNDEIGEIEGLLKILPSVMDEGSRVVLISFHSLEDRLVKYAFRSLKETGWKLITKRPVVPTEQEIMENPRSRSAKLRVIER